MVVNKSASANPVTSQGWDEDVFQDLHTRSQDIAARFERFCAGDHKVPYFMTYFHIEFPGSDDRPVDDNRTSDIDNLQERFGLNEHECERALEARNADDPQAKILDMHEQSARQIVLHGLFLEAVCGRMKNKPHTKFYGFPRSEMTRNRWVVVMKSGNVVLQGRRNLYPYPESNETAAMGFMYKADRKGLLTIRVGVAKLREFVLGVALGGQSR